VPPSPEVDVPHALNSLDPIAGHADAASPAFVCSCTDGGLDAAWVHVAGELDLATAPELERTLRATQQQARLVLLDLRELTFMDRAGVHTIVNASINARKLGRRLVLLRGPPNVDRMFALTGSSDAVEIGDLDHSPAAPSVHALQRSLVSSSLLRTG
jgi:anti-sigma B factor antagonist